MPKGQKYISWSLRSPEMSCNLQHIFLWFLKSSWIAWRLKITILKFEKSWNVLITPKYISMVFKSLLDWQNVKNIFFEVLQVLECLRTFKIISMIFKSRLDCPKVKSIFLEVWEVLRCLATFNIFFCDFWNPPGLPEG